MDLYITRKRDCEGFMGPAYVSEEKPGKLILNDAYFTVYKIQAEKIGE